MLRSLIRAVVMALACAALVALEAPSPALAHAEPERAEPAIGGTVEAAPAKIEIWFGEEIAEGSTIEVQGPDGARVDLDDAAIDLNDPDHRHMTVSLPADLPGGVYTVSWTSISAEDGDSAEGTYTFTVAGGTPVASPAASPAASPVATPTGSPTAAEPLSTPTATSSGTSDDGGFDGEAFGLSVLAGLVAALFIYGFWRLVRPKTRA